MSTPALDIQGFKDRTMGIVSEDVDLVESKYPGFTARRIAIAQSRIYSQLEKRYATPFAAPIPEIVLGWITDVVTPDVRQKVGRYPQDPLIQDLKDARDRALAEVKEAADAEHGLFDLPLNQNSEGSSAISHGGPLGCSQQDPYAWADDQLEAIRGR